MLFSKREILQQNSRFLDFQVNSTDKLLFREFKKQTNFERKTKKRISLASAIVTASFRVLILTKIRFQLHVNVGCFPPQRLEVSSLNSIKTSGEYLKRFTTMKDRTF